MIAFIYSAFYSGTLPFLVVLIYLKLKIVFLLRTNANKKMFFFQLFFICPLNNTHTPHQLH